MIVMHPSILSILSNIPTNPYINRVMIRDVKHFYGRKRDIDRLYARIGSERPQSVSITGERRIGKSSLLWHLMQPENVSRQLPNPEKTIFIFLDFQENRGMTTDDFCAAVLNKLRDKFEIKQESGYDALLSTTQKLDSEGYKLILLLDEFETVTQNPDFDARFYAFLRALANRYNVAYMTSSRLPLQHLCHSKQISDSPFFNIFSSMHLRGFTEEEAKELIIKPSKEAGLPLEPYLDFLMDAGGTYPFFLQIACSALFEYIQFGDELDEMGKEDVFDSILEEADPHFTYIWEQMDEKERQVCQAIIDGETIERRERSILRSLIQKGYAYESSQGIKLFSALFIQWLEEASEEPSVTKGSYAPEAIVVIDICGSTRLSNSYGAHRLRALYEELEGIVTEISGRFRERYRRTTGDGVLLTFHTVTDAVNASLEIQRHVNEHNEAANEQYRIPIRFSIHFGETLVDEEERRYGDAVNMAFKVESLGTEDLSHPLPSEGYMLVTEQVARELAMTPGISCEELGAFELHGFTGLHRIYQLIRAK